MSVVKVENLSKLYLSSLPRLKSFFRMSPKPPVEALRDVSFAIEQGEIFGLIGRNGAGKTTLSKIIATLVTPSAGTVTVGGFDSVRDDVKVRSLIGLASAEERSFYWRLTCAQNMMFFARLYGMDDRTARGKIADLFEKTNLTPLADRRFSELSTGNKQRLAVARALMSEPPVLLLDEPTRSLDPLAAAEMRALIASLENVSILLTSHNLSEIEELCGRVAVIAKGTIRDVGTPDELRHRHRRRQRVRIVFTSGEDIAAADFEFVADPAIDEHNATTIVRFTRDAEDDSLGRAIALLHARGARISEVETENSTLLDVLESYDD